MARSLKFDWNGLYNALSKHLVSVLNTLIDEVYRESTSGLSDKGKADSEKEQAEYEAGKELITASCVFYANAIVESFGTGVWADTSSDSYWNEYKNNSPFWNPERTGILVVGRPAGEYTNIWGEQKVSRGTRAKQPMAGGQNKMGNHVIQTMEAWIIKNGETRIERRLEVEIARFLQENASKYFIETGK